MSRLDEHEKQLFQQIKEYAQRKRVSATTLARWQAWQDEDKAALLSLLQDLQCGENHLKGLLDWLEEIALRDTCSIVDILGRRELQKIQTMSGSRNDKLKAAKKTLRKIRYPRLTQLEENTCQAVKALDLGRAVQVSLPPDFEGDEITVSLKAKNVQELGDRLVQLQQRIEDGGFQRVFEALDEV